MQMQYPGMTQSGSPLSADAMDAIRQKAALKRAAKEGQAPVILCMNGQKNAGSACVGAGGLGVPLCGDVCGEKRASCFWPWLLFLVTLGALLVAAYMAFSRRWQKKMYEQQHLMHHDGMDDGHWPWDANTNANAKAHGPHAMDAEYGMGGWPWQQKAALAGGAGAGALGAGYAASRAYGSKMHQQMHQRKPLFCRD